MPVESFFIQENLASSNYMEKCVIMLAELAVFELYMFVTSANVLLM